MMLSVKKIGNKVKSYPFVYHTGLTLYNFFHKIFIFLTEGYLRIIEWILPRGFFVESVPDYVAIHYKEYKSDVMNYHRRQGILYRDYTRLINSKYILDIISKLPEGDYAELGTYRGKFARFIYKYKNPEAHLYCFDTFEGFHKKDVEIEKDRVNLHVKEGFFSNTSLDVVRENIVDGVKRQDQLTLVKGYFPETFKGYENKKWRFVLLDADLYEPMKEGVKLFWPAIVSGGVMMIHDYYGGYTGTQKAIDEYFLPKGIRPVPLGDKAGTAIVFKDVKQG